MRLLVLGECVSDEGDADEERLARKEWTDRIIEEISRSAPYLWKGAKRMSLPAPSDRRPALTERCKAIAERSLRNEDPHSFHVVVAVGDAATAAAARYFSTTPDAFAWTPTRVGDHVIVGLPHPPHPAIAGRDDPLRARVRSALSRLEAMLFPLAEVA